MIENLDKIKGMEFSFPIKNASEAKYKVVSVNELNPNNLKTIKMEGNWAAVILAEYSTNQFAYMVPAHVVFTIEYDTKDIPMFKITAVTSDNDSAKIQVGRGAVSTPDKFFECLKQIAEVINLKV